MRRAQGENFLLADAAGAIYGCNDKAFVCVDIVAGRLADSQKTDAERDPEKLQAFRKDRALGKETEG
jgi:hypothetical protein